jgi:hypothetical protein
MPSAIIWSCPASPARSPVSWPRRSPGSLAQAEAVDHDTLVQTLALVTGADMPDPVMAKLMKAIGRSFARKADAFDPAADNAAAGGKAAYVEAALAALARALALDRAIGVKKDIERLERQQKALTETP